MDICLAETTTLQATFTEDAEACVGGGFSAMEVWLTKLEKHLESSSVADTRRMLADKNVITPAAAYQGGLLLSQGPHAKPISTISAAGWNSARGSASAR